MAAKAAGNESVGQLWSRAWSRWRWQRWWRLRSQGVGGSGDGSCGGTVVGRGGGGGGGGGGVEGLPPFSMLVAVAVMVAVVVVVPIARMMALVAKADVAALW